MAGSRKLEIEIIGDASKLDKELKNAEKSAGKFGGNFKKVGLAAGAGLAVVGVALKGAVGAALEAEKAEARFNDAMKNVNATSKERASTQQKISELSKKAALDDEDLSDVFSKLVRTTGDVAKAQEAMALSADIARARNISLEAASKGVERAYNGNSGALKKLGIEIDAVSTHSDALKAKIETQKDSMKGLEGAELEAAKAVLSGLENQKEAAKQRDKDIIGVNALEAAQKKFAGAAEAYGDTAAGAQEKFGIAVENLQEKIGQKLLPVLAKLTEAAVKVITWMEENWPRLEKIIAPVMENIKRKIETALEHIQEFWDKHGETILAIVTKVFTTMRTMIENVMQVIQGVIDVVMGVITGDWRRAWDGIKAIVTNIFDNILLALGLILPLLGAAAKKIGEAILDGVVDIVTALPGKVWDLTKAIGTRYIEAYATVLGWGRDLAMKIVNGIINAVEGIGGKVWEVTKEIGSRYIEAYATILGWGRDLAGQIVGGIVNGLENIGGKVWNIINDIGAKIREMGETIKDWGSSIIGKIVGGITGAAKDLWGAVTDIFDKLPGFVKKILGIGSPSKVFADIGHDLVAGLVKGLNDKAGDLRNAAMDMAKSIAGDAWDKLSGVAKGAGNAIAGAAGAVGGALGIGGGDGPTTGSGVGSGHVYGDIHGLASSFMQQLNMMSAGHGQAISVTSGFRTFAEQAALVAQKGLWSASNPTGAAAPGTSKHESGRAADISPTRNSWPFAGNYGLRFPIGAEPWHVESYDKGGWLMPGLTLARNMTGRPERVIGPNGGGGGTVLQLHVHGPVYGGRAGLRELGDQLANYIDERDRTRTGGRRLSATPSLT